ncbi:hypothetical protein [Chitinophaga japonensis]|uniref:Nucleic acid-binding protein n=1 Tax=Chitinophaga japonensis TaxID=104662 RepID=A0A562TBZ7_CHIJA|nr:hypothetical protein [Chitinophaga japonensis]TWI91025.1 hypothetical protein LX66_0386 [Chitinophaga japonensis]
MTIAITDANIFIDLCYLDLLHLLFSLEYEMIVTAEVLEELNPVQQNKLASYITKGQLQVYAFSTDEVIALTAFHISSALSYSDHSVLFLARKLAAVVLSGDNRLRSECARQHIPVHGILWVFDMSIDKQQINKREAAGKLEALMQFNKRLPLPECNRRLEQWRH